MCLTHTLSDVSSVFFDHTAPGIESQDRGVERQNMQSFWEIYGKHIQSSGGDYLYQKQPLISLNCMWSSIVLEFCLLFHLFLFGFGLKPSKSTCQGKPLDTLSPWISRCQDTSRPGNLLEETWMVWMKVEMAWPVKDHFVHPKRFEGNVFLSSSLAVRNDRRTSSGIHSASQDLQGKMSSWKMPSTVSERYESSGTYLVKVQFSTTVLYTVFELGFVDLLCFILHPNPVVFYIVHT